MTGFGNESCVSFLSELRFKLAKPSLKLPLRCRLFASVQKAFARRGRLCTAEGLPPARSGGVGEHISRCPETRAGQESMFHASAGQLHKLCIAQEVVVGCAHIFVG